MHFSAMGVQHSCVCERKKITLLCVGEKLEFFSPLATSDMWVRGGEKKYSDTVCVHFCMWERKRMKESACAGV